MGQYANMSSGNVRSGKKWNVLLPWAAITACGLGYLSHSVQKEVAGNQEILASLRTCSLVRASSHDEAISRCARNPPDIRKPAAFDVFPDASTRFIDG